MTAQEWLEELLRLSEAATPCRGWLRCSELQ